MTSFLYSVSLPPKQQRLPSCSGLKCKMHPWNKLTKHELIISIRSEYNPVQLFGYLIPQFLHCPPPPPLPMCIICMVPAEPQLSNSGDVTIQIWEHGQSGAPAGASRGTFAASHWAQHSRSLLIFPGFDDFYNFVTRCWSLQMIAAEAWWMWLMLMGIW